MTGRSKIGKYYVTRDRHGRFKKWVRVGKSLKADRRVRAPFTARVKRGYGNQGDIC
jgi:hypothetical protein